MPIYEYECTKCGDHLEVIQKFSDKPLKKCGRCSGKLQKLISQSTFHLKGSGWYVTDYANKSSSNTGSSGKTETQKPKEEKKTEKAADTSSD